MILHMLIMYVDVPWIIKKKPFICSYPFSVPKMKRKKTCSANEELFNVENFLKK